MTERTGGAFDALLTDIEDLNKAMAPGCDEGADGTAKDDAKIEAAAAEGDAGKDADGDGGASPDGDGDEVLGKSFKVKLDDGTELDAVDGVELFKSLMARVEGNEETVVKAITGLIDLNKSLRAEVTSLNAKVAALGNSGAGRKAVVTVAEKAPVETVAKSEASNTMSGEEFLSKALTAQAAGKITGADVAYAENLLGAGKQVPEALVRKVLS